jgi:hypothetical protein
MSNYLTFRVIVFGLSLGRSRFREIYFRCHGAVGAVVLDPEGTLEARAIAAPMDGAARS